MFVANWTETLWVYFCGFIRDTVRNVCLNYIFCSRNLMASLCTERSSPSMQSVFSNKINLGSMSIFYSSESSETNTFAVVALNLQM